MKRNYASIWVSVAAVTLLCSGTGDLARAGVDANPFVTILEGNPFRLRPEPPPQPEAPPPPAPAVPLATVELTGITSILSSERALLEIVPGPGKPMVRPILAAGERIDSVELLAIDLARGEVTIRNGNVTTNVGLKVPKATTVASSGGNPAERVEKTLGGSTGLPNASDASGTSPQPGRSAVVLGGGAGETVPRRQIRAATAPSFPPLPGRP